MNWRKTPKARISWLSLIILVIVSINFVAFSVISSSNLFEEIAFLPIVFKQPTPTPTNKVMGTSIPIETPAATSQPSATQTPTATTTLIPVVGENLLVNGDFHDDFNGWSMTNGYWGNHPPISCEASGTRYVEMDIDTCKCGKWQVGYEDRLWQDVPAPEHSRVVFSMTEAHHMRDGIAEVTLYGSQDGQKWTIVFHRPEVESPFGTGKCQKGLPPASFTYTIDDSFPYYRLEVHGKMVDKNDGFLFGEFKLVVEP